MNIKPTVDEPEDFELISNILEYMNDSTYSFSYLKVIDLLTKYPELFNINKDHVRDMGLIRFFK